MTKTNQKGGSFAGLGRNGYFIIANGLIFLLQSQSLKFIITSRLIEVVMVVLKQQSRALLNLALLAISVASLCLFYLLSAGHVQCTYLNKL